MTLGSLEIGLSIMLIGSVIAFVIALVVQRYYHIKTIGDKDAQHQQLKSKFKSGSTTKLNELKKIFAVLDIMNENDKVFLLYGLSHTNSPPTFVILEDNKVKFVTGNKPDANTNIMKLYKLLKNNQIECKFIKIDIPVGMEMDEEDIEFIHNDKNSD